MLEQMKLTQISQDLKLELSKGALSMVIDNSQLVKKITKKNSGELFFFLCALRKILFFSTSWGYLIKFYLGYRN